ncbi:MAG: hypothetical protein JOZ13_08115 [Alphaproteobacteria bacterium]|nr:hypothetical protein [Alphaproteobacteria bacterium]
MVSDIQSIETLVRSGLDDMKSKALSSRSLAAQDFDPALEERFGSIEIQLRDLLQAYVDRCIDDGGITAW